MAKKLKKTQPKARIIFSRKFYVPVFIVALLFLLTFLYLNNNKNKTLTEPKEESISASPTTTTEAIEEETDEPTRIGATNTPANDQMPTVPPSSPTSWPSPADARITKVNLYGNTFIDLNCNGARDGSDYPAVHAEMPVNISDGVGVNVTTKADKEGHWNYSTSIDSSSYINLTATIVPSSGLISTPNFESVSVTLTSDITYYAYDFPLVFENSNSCGQ